MRNSININNVYNSYKHQFINHKQSTNCFIGKNSDIHVIKMNIIYNLLKRGKGCICCKIREE